MAASSLSIVAAATAASSSSPSIPLHTKLSNLSFTHSPIPLPSTHFPPKPLILKSHNLSSLPFSLLSLHQLCRASAAFDADFDVATTEDVKGTEEEDPPMETEEEIYEGEEEEEEERKESQSGEVGRLYVGNLPYSMTSSQLVEVFEEAGRVVSVEIVYDRVTDRSRGFAFVTMGSVAEAKEAIRMFDGSQVGGRTVKVNFPEVPRGGEREVMGPKIRSSYRGFIDTPHKIYAGNLGWALTSQGLRDAFAKQPGFLSAKVIYDRNSGRSRGFGFVSFASAEEVESALNAMNGVEVEGRPLRLNLAAERASPLPPPPPPPSPPALETNTETGLYTSEMLSSIST
ncbi:hypothetical protein L1049_007676 [Liquidambar formosana]|uniref:RRM domain-containing protein n=1 Tax=Liquidambar formosana TaxID=63359 RepID=A0AAP0S1T8_LIQFO